MSLNVIFLSEYYDLIFPFTKIYIRSLVFSNYNFNSKTKLRRTFCKRKNCLRIFSRTSNYFESSCIFVFINEIKIRKIRQKKKLCNCHLLFLLFLYLITLFYCILGDIFELYITYTQTPMPYVHCRLLLDPEFS